MSTATQTSPASVPVHSRALHVGVWVVQVLLALAFAMAGVMKASQPIEVLAPGMPWVTAVPEWLLRVIGVSELLAAIGLVAPAATRILPILTPVAAGGLVLIMSLAIPLHLSRGEYDGVVVNLVLGSLAAFVAWGRGLKAPIAAR